MDKKIILICILIALLSCTTTLLLSQGFKSGSIGKVYRNISNGVEVGK